MMRHVSAGTPHISGYGMSAIHPKLPLASAGFGQVGRAEAVGDEFADGVALDA